MRAYTYEGRNEEEALRNASDELGVLPEDLTYEVVEKRSGVLGFGGQVKIRVQFRGDLIEEGGADAPPPIPAAPAFAEASTGKPKAAAVEAPAPVAKVAPAPEAPAQGGPLSAKGERALEVTLQIVRGMGLEAGAVGEENADGITIHVRSGDDNLVIGRGGVVLDAIQFIVNKIVNRYPDDRKFVVVDVSGYRKRKTESLERFAAEMCRKTLASGKTTRLKELTPRERRLVHMIVAQHPGLESRSEGDGDDRVLLIQTARGPRNAQPVEADEGM
jgi:spoIIIJ-associated protein